MYWVINDNKIINETTESNFRKKDNIASASSDRKSEQNDTEYGEKKTHQQLFEKQIIMIRTAIFIIQNVNLGLNLFKACRREGLV